MVWLSRFRGSGKDEPADPWDETVIDGALYNAPKTTRSSSENAAPAGDSPDAQIAHEIKRRQISLVVRYVSAVRGR
jgi:hypothetical protein